MVEVVGHVLGEIDRDWSLLVLDPYLGVVVCCFYVSSEEFLAISDA